MCVVSMVTDHYQQMWPLMPQITPQPYMPIYPDQPARESHVPDEMKGLAMAVDGMERELSGLVERLHSVLPRSPQPATATGGGIAPVDSYRVPLAADIRALRNRVDAMVSNVRRIVAEVEL